MSLIYQDKCGIPEHDAVRMLINMISHRCNSSCHTVREAYVVYVLPLRRIYHIGGSYYLKYATVLCHKCADELLKRLANRGYQASLHGILMIR